MTGLQETASADVLLDGPEFQVNTYTTDAQGLPSVAADGAGNFMVVWYSRGQDGSGASVQGQRFDGTGAAVGTEFQVNTYTTYFQWGPAVASDGSGGFIVVWTSYVQDGNSGGVHGQRYDSSGAPDGTEFQVNTHTTSSQYGAAVSSDAHGRVMVVWQSSGQDGSQFSVHGQWFDSTGAPAGTEFQVNTYTTSAQYHPDVASLASGGFVVVWHSYSQDGSSDSIQGQRFDSTGTPDGSEFQVNTYTTYSQQEPAVASDAAGGFVVVWVSYGQDGSGSSVHGQRFDSTGAPDGTEFRVNTYTTAGQHRAAVSSDARGGFVVVWDSIGQEYNNFSVHGQRFDSTGAPDGTEFDVSTYTTNDQWFPDVSADATGKFVVVWTSGGSSGSDSSFESVQGQRYTTAPTTTTTASSSTTSTTTTFPNTTSTSTTTTLRPAGSCLSGPYADCSAGGRTVMDLKVDADSARDSLRWKWVKGAATVQADLGDPTSGTIYRLCVYDHATSTPVLATSLTLPPGDGWSDRSPKGLAYRDSGSASGGVRSIRIKTGIDSRAKIALKAKGDNIPMPMPVSPFQFFTQQPSVIVQLVNSAGKCWASEFAVEDTRKNDGGRFKAKAR